LPRNTAKLEAFSVTIQYTPEDLQQAYNIHYSKVYPVAGRLLLILGLISLVFGIGLLLYSYMAISFTNWFAWFLLVYGVVVIAIYIWRVRTVGKRMFAKMPDFLHPYEYTFSQKGILAAGMNVNSDNNWGYYTRYCHTPDMILLYPNKFRFNLYPRKHFTDEQYAQLFSWIVEHVPATFKKKQK
jgi:hypothetical protein